jgi:hypothetical protein
VVATDAPPAARGPAIDPARGWLVEEIRGGAYWVTDGDYQARRGLTLTLLELDAPERPRWTRLLLG